MNKMKLGIFGCGKVTESLHLPVALQSVDFDVACLVDAHLPRAKELASRYGIPLASNDYRKVLNRIEAVILATPNHLHAPMTIDLLKHGIHVLVEKPMALNSADCDAMLQAAKNNHRVLSVGLVRRFYSISQFVKQVIENRILGDICGFDFQEGGIFSWKVSSDFMFRKEAGGGVLADTGIHTLDLLLWWLGDAEIVHYLDDAAGGVEADCKIKLRLKNGASGIVELSRLRTMRNTYIIFGERGTLEIGNSFDAELSIGVKGLSQMVKGRILTDGQPDHSIHEVFEKQLNNFANAVKNGTEPLVSGGEGQRAVKLIEDCVKLREPLRYPWSVPVGNLEVCQ